MKNLFTACACACACALFALTPFLAVAQTVVEPGETVEIKMADDCDVLVGDDLGGKAEARCDALASTLGALVSVGDTGGEAGALSAVASLWADIQVASTPETEGNSVPAWFDFAVVWAGLIERLDAEADARVVLRYAITDEKTTTDIASGLLWAKSASGMMMTGGGDLPEPKAPNVDEGSAIKTESVLLSRGNTYRFSVRLTCTGSATGAETEGASCDYFDEGEGYGAAVERLAVTLGGDDQETSDRLDQLEEDVEALQDDVEALQEDVEAIEDELDAINEDLDEVQEDVEALKEHDHDYLTGRGQGHNNTDAKTSPPNLEDNGDDDGPVIQPVPKGGPKSNNNPNETPPGQQSASTTGVSQGSGGGGAVGAMSLLLLAALAAAKPDRGTTTDGGA